MQPTKQQKIPQAQSIKGLLVAVGILSVLAVIVGFLGSIYYTISLFGVDTDTEQYANAFIFTTTLALFTGFASFNIGKRAGTAAPLNATIFLGILSAMSFVSGLSSSGFELTKLTSLYTTLFFGCFLSAPIFVLTMVILSRQQPQKLKARLLGFLAILILFAVLVITPLQVMFDKDRANLETRQSSSNEPEIVDVQEKLGNTGSRELKTAAATMVNALYIAYDDDQSLEVAPAVPAGYELTKFNNDGGVIHMCIKPINFDAYLYVTTMPYRKNSTPRAYHYGIKSECSDEGSSTLLFSNI